MYSPKIKEDLVPKLYRLAKARGVRMTTLVDGIIRTALAEVVVVEEERVMQKSVPCIVYAEMKQSVPAAPALIAENI